MFTKFGTSFSQRTILESSEMYAKKNSINLEKKIYFRVKLQKPKMKIGNTSSHHHYNTPHYNTHFCHQYYNNTRY